MESGITVVIPVYNRAEPVGETLASLLAQTYRPMAVVLVDNNSTDASLSVLQEWKRKNQNVDLSIQVLTEGTPGAAAARNAGLAAVTTDRVMFFDSDDIMAPDHLARIMETVRKHPDADIVGWDVAYESPHRRSVERFHASGTAFGSLFRGDMATQRWCARTGLVRAAGGWNTGISLWDDIELGLRMLAAQPRIVKIDGSPTVTVRYTPDSITGSHDEAYVRKLMRSADVIAADLGAGGRLWLGCVLMRESALCRLSGTGPRIVGPLEQKALSLASGTSSRLLLRFCRRFTAAGGRGLHYILKPIIGHLEWRPSHILL